MNIKLKRIIKKNKNKLEKLIQLYLHDLSLYFPIDFDSSKCTYNYDLNSYFEKNKAYFIENEEENLILGFILVDINESDNYEISEIFVLNNFKKQHIGQEAVFKIFDKYKGNWTIKAVPLSESAEQFWNKTIKKYTKDNYTLTHTGKYDRAEFYFTNK